MEKTVYYEKLVRDKIPQIIEENGGRCRVEVLDKQAYIAKLEEKLAQKLPKITTAAWQILPLHVEFEGAHIIHQE